jgi:alpha-amylase
MNTSRLLFFFFFSSLLCFGKVEAQQNDRVVLQAFYWNYYNTEYPSGWANYLVELAPRLKSMGIDAVWIPPSFKNANPASVGYSPFDLYDLGDKFQKGNLKTPLGDKDELLRLIAVMHTNGIEVIQDITLNHSTDAGNTNSAGGQDPVAVANYNDNATSGFKNFRYVCYETPYGDHTAYNYLNRKGRWPKNYQNFYPNANHVCCTDDLNSVYWGPDIAYESDSYGESSCINCYNPTQDPDYMKTQARDWFVWFRKQTGIDGYRFDAVKHFPSDIVEDLLWNVQSNAGFASGGDDIFAVGEYVGSAFQMDNWANATQNRAGTFDFGLRGSIRDMVYGLGGYNLSNIPGSQQSNRLRTVPFVNNHDTFRPTIDANGGYSGWDVANELGGHVDPNEPRHAAAYAIAMAVDGSPLIFMEDLFVLDGPNRYTNHPDMESELPLRDDIANIIWCHQKLQFKQGAYIVRHSSNDHLIIERSGKAIIGVNDGWSTWQGTWIPTNFAPGTQLHDYSGANSDDIYVNEDGWVQIWSPPCDGSNYRRGYTIWGPAGISGNLGNKGFATLQEWHLANDLGDSHAASLGQGGELPDYSLATRTAGKIFNRKGKMRVQLFPADPSLSLTLILADATGENHLDSIAGTGNLTKIWTTPGKGWFTLKVRNTTDVQQGQEAWVRATYGTPRKINTSAFPKSGSNASGKEISAQDAQFKLFPNPAQGVLNISSVVREESISYRIFDLHGRLIKQSISHNVYTGRQEIEIHDLNSGMYLIELTQGTHREQLKFAKY